MKKSVLAYAIQHKPGDFPFIGLIEMPMGAEPFGVAPLPEGAGLSLIAVVDPRLTIIDHPVFIMEPGVVIEEPVGKKVGAFIGFGSIGGKSVGVFRCEPWPKTVLEGGARIEGQA